jgi:hypothetical protein
MPGHARWVCLMIPVAKQLWLEIRSRPRAAGSNLTVSLRAGPDCSETAARRKKKAARSHAAVSPEVPSQVPTPWQRKHRPCRCCEQSESIAYLRERGVEVDLVAKLRFSRGCEVCRKSAAICLKKKKKNARRAAPL